MKRSVLIIDDEEAARLLIRQYLEGNEQFEIAGEFDNGLDAVTGINTLEPDLVFLDVKMPGLSGLQVVQEIVHVPQIIFTTAYDRYALKAFDANATDYLLKPYTRERFEKSLSKTLHYARPNFEEARKVAEQLTGRAPETVGTILVETGSKLISLELKDVICMEAERDYTWMHTAQKSYLSNHGISQLEKRLSPAQFLRVHRSFIVNIGHIKEVHKEGASAQLVTSSGKVVAVSRTYMPDLKRLIY